MKMIDLTGKKFGKLRVIDRVEGCKRVYFNVECDCGTKKAVQSRHLLSGAVVSCGCHRKTNSTSHGMHKTRPYKIWHGMITRCTNPNRKEYKNYGGRGIVVCEMWHDFRNFWEDMKDGYSDGLSIDRIDNDGDYEPGNCRWSTQKEQARNTSKNRMLYLDGKSVCIAEAAEITGINKFALRARLEKGESGERLFAKRIASGRKRSGQTERPVLNAATKAVALAVIAMHKEQ